MDASKQIQVLLTQYERLKAEILQRIAEEFRFVAVAGAIGALGFFSRLPLTTLQKSLVAASVAACLYFFYRAWSGMNACVRGAIQTEIRINDLAGVDLLTWESSLHPNLAEELKAAYLEQKAKSAPPAKQDAAASL